jgi:histidinol dehydrogenase
MPAGPSEVMVVADSSANPSFVAADLLAQTEHIGGRGILLTNSLKLAKEVEKNLKEQIPNLSAQSQTFISQNKIDLVVVKDIAQALDIANDYAPEHLMLEVVKPQYWKTKVVNAGSVFLGNYSSEALGDYVSGTNHVLPTNQYAKCYSGLCTEAFMKSITFSNITKAGILDMKNATATLADLESLDAHKQSVLIRCEQIKNQKEKK